MFFATYHDAYDTSYESVAFVGPFASEFEAHEFCNKLNDLHPDHDACIAYPSSPAAVLEEKQEQYGDEEDEEEDEDSDAE
jgi:hypothetical protein